MLTTRSKLHKYGVLELPPMQQSSTLGTVESFFVHPYYERVRVRVTLSSVAASGAEVAGSYLRCHDQTHALTPDGNDMGFRGIIMIHHGNTLIAHGNTTVCRGV